MIQTLTEKDIRELIRFAIGQAPAGLYARANMKSPETRLKAMEELTKLVAARFDGLTVTRELKDGWDRP